ncbi:structure-specific endonuclease subunit slx1 [Euwallacea similis]|uniref:structure-specific endonuclease subunit slx1 n=1 Tax=Euwallacea similis TaxID=1736056 RepID=UPI00344CA29A
MNETIIEKFYGVYLLYCLNPKYTGRTYIGYTVDPNRRIKQHNKGNQFGGARRTSNRGPWTMVLIIHGFPSDISALRFEWAWQHPRYSRRLQHVTKKKSKEKMYDFCLRVLSEMLHVGPWNRLPLTIRWLNDDFIKEFPIGKGPPLHMPICYGPVISKQLPKLKLTQQDLPTNSDTCYVCLKPVEISRKVTCLESICTATFHIICMSKNFLADDQYVPIEGNCPKCKNHFLWGDIVRKFMGCYRNIDFKMNVEGGNDFYDSEEDN